MGGLMEQLERRARALREPEPEPEVFYRWDGTSLTISGHEGLVLFPINRLGLAECLLWFAAAEQLPTQADALAFEDLVLATLRGPFQMQRQGIRNFLECWRAA